MLVAEDDRVARDLLCEILRGEGFNVEAVDDGAGAIERAAAGRYDLVVSDVRMERSSGLDVLKAFTDKAPGTPVILITAFGDVTGAMEAIQRGAYDYVSKPFNIEELKLTVTRALERRRLVAENRTVQSETKTQIEDIVGKSAVMLEVYKLVARVAASTATVLVTGESGTGKELVARAIHTHSPRARAAFVPVNCTALTESLLESELFGHARGAFTGAVGAKRGLFEMASGGTMFLDEIGDMGPKMQAQLLRTLQDGEVRPVGGSESIRVDVRLVCATNKDLDEEVKAGRFREDLYFRINVVTVRLPPLRERREDVPILVAHFLAKIARRERREQAALSPEALRLLTALRLAGQRARAGERHRSRGRCRQGQRDPAVGPAARGRRRRARSSAATAAASSRIARRWPSSSGATSRSSCKRAAATRRRPPRSWASIAARSTARSNAPGPTPASPTTTSDDAGAGRRVEAPRRRRGAARDRPDRRRRRRPRC